MKEVGLADYRSTEGNRGAWCLHRRDGDVVHVEMFTLWDDLKTRSAALPASELHQGQILRLRSRLSCSSCEPEVTHFEVIEA